MTTQVQKISPNNFSKIEQVLVRGDLSGLNEQERVTYVNAVCESVGLNPLTRPFDYITLNGKLVLYAKRDATDQLRNVRGVSIKITSREQVGDIYVVTAQAALPDGREDESTGAVQIAGLRGDMLANAMMKAETKAKRRVTLSICGLGLLDETEVESIPPAHAKPTEKNVEQPKSAPVVKPIEAPKPLAKTKGSVGAEVIAISEKMGMDKIQLAEWAQDVFKKPTTQMSVEELERFKTILLEQAGRNGIPV